MGFYERVVLPRVVDRVIGTRAVAEERHLALAEVSGRVLELGFGSGLNLPHYPSSVSQLFAIDPTDTGAKMAKDRIAAAPFPVEFAPLRGEELPFGEGEFDGVVATFTLCTIPGVEQALSEARRVLRPSGRLYFLEHGRSDDPAVHRLQVRLRSVWAFIGGGCQLDRDVPGLVEGAGFRLGPVERYESEGPRFAAPRFRGWAEK
ncbi:MAG: class I SAM-dependent methyltransferase [Deltaproteobacteria bacterium]|nr:class I SAM-dependent methyltransferase [Deltaproteobacteria bacterium]